MAREEPVGRPDAKAADRRDPRLHLVVRKGGELGEVELCPGDADHVLGLAPREAEREQLVLLRASHAFARRERVRVLGPLAVALDEAVADRERREQRDLLRGDRPDEHLERIG